MVKAAPQQAQQTLSNYDVAVVASVRPFARDIAELREGEAEEKECSVEELPAFGDFQRFPRGCLHQIYQLISAVECQRREHSSQTGSSQMLR
jgi:hypothetical protein